MNSQALFFCCFKNIRQIFLDHCFFVESFQNFSKYSNFSFVNKSSPDRHSGRARKTILQVAKFIFTIATQNNTKKKSQETTPENNEDLKASPYRCIVSQAIQTYIEVKRKSQIAQDTHVVKESSFT